MIDGRNLFDRPINSMTKTYENIRRIATGQRDDYTTGWLLDYSYFKENYKSIAIDLTKQHALDADPRAIQQINLTTNIGRAGNTTMFFITEGAKKICFGLFTRNCQNFVNAIPLNAKYSLIFISIK